ncbi:hypothetical protein PsorP6_006377 [Peronosclerospora sorghi]|uniref:Uncharacterized protein n=1 Tax=Peronosclerospora sorghi TaxID=230839 RepID=A0ACC0W4V4_9STRA|nr:hypothetical protein PsorP6_006377 [Peronosclerospora sorghi]
MKHTAAGRTAAWGNNDTRPELQTVTSRFLRVVFIWFLTTVWVLGIPVFVLLCCLSLWHMAQWLVTRTETPIPHYVPIFVSFMALYEGYYYITKASEHRWPWMRKVMRHMHFHYPYFRLNMTVFDERQEAKRKGRDEESEGMIDKAVSKAVEENDMTSCVNPNDHALFAFHPHGVLSCGWSVGGVQHMSFAQADCRWLVAASLFYFPIMRELVNWMDFASVAKGSFREILRTGQNVCLLPGGFEEATLYERGKHRVYIKMRFGFIKLALQHGYKIHPVYTFGEEYAYHTFPYLLKIRLKLNQLKMPGVLFFGSPSCFYLPKADVDLITVVGKPLILPRIEHPTQDNVRKYHEQYVTALQTLFDRYKKVCAVNPEAQLEIY